MLYLLLFYIKNHTVLCCLFVSEITQFSIKSEFARNCCMARMLPREIELVLE